MEFIVPRGLTRAPSDKFTGDVWIDVLHAGDGSLPTRVTVGRFAPEARTFWHSHVRGQTLHIVSGTALIGTRDGVLFEAHPGETVRCPPGEEHWHGADDDEVMEHVAIWDTGEPGGADTRWLEEVTDAERRLPRTRRAD